MRRKMEKKGIVKMALTPKETDECLNIIEEYRKAPQVVGYIFLVIKPLHPDLLIWLLSEKRFDDVGIVLVFLNGMAEESVRLFLKQRANWDNGRIDRAITRAKIYYFYYSKFEK
jgi:hypothetical protein